MKRFIPFAKQFTKYIVSGGLAAVVDFGSYALLLRISNLHWWYTAASVTGSILGFITAFLLHKYFVFEKKNDFLKHLSRYIVADIINTGLTTLLLIGLVEWVGLGKEAAKIVAMGTVVAWNFFLYKFVVYV
ncbi:MAG: GtrA family protein [Candidatus Peribacteraceae bacterium]|nr:GtrA family protein [Candidatus Peribacteraceae bacterium]